MLPAHVSFFHANLRSHGNYVLGKVSGVLSRGLLQGSTLSQGSETPAEQEHEEEEPVVPAISV